MANNQSRTTYTGGGDYRETYSYGNYAEGNIHINSPRTQQNLTEAAAEIQQLLKQLEKTYNPDDPVEQIQMAAEVVKQIDTNPNQKQRLLSSVGAGSIAALEALLDHPASSFVIAAIQKWKETQPENQS
ncbi:hypothetical protein [Myxosarcina sp. GI1(2024)]